MKKYSQRYVYGMFLLIILAPLFLGSPVRAGAGRTAGDEFEMNINISGTVVANGSCTFEAGSGADLEVGFGNVNFSTINGFELEGNYRKVLNSSMTCTDDSAGAVMTFANTAAGTVDFNGHKLLPVSVGNAISKNLGIQLLVDGVVQDVGTNFEVNTDSPPSIEAELVQIGATDVVNNGANLRASARLTVAFQ